MFCVLFCFSLVVNVSHAETYILRGSVESVSYTDSDKWPCYVAVRDSRSSRSLYYHASKTVEICHFAERYKEFPKDVILRGVVDDGANIVATLELADNEAMYWNDPKNFIG